MTNLVKLAAARAGLPRFYTGVPCAKGGHLHERYTSNGACVACVYAAKGLEAPPFEPPTPVAGAPLLPPKINKGELLATIPEHQFRVFDVEWPALEAVTIPLCLAAAPGLTVEDVRSKKAPTRRNGGTGMYTVRVPLPMLELVKGLVQGLFAKHAMTDDQVAAARAAHVREAAQLAIDERPPIPDWSFK